MPIKYTKKGFHNYLSITTVYSLYSLKNWHRGCFGLVKSKTDVFLNKQKY